MTKELSGYPSIDKPWLKYYSMATLRWELMEGCLKIMTRNEVDHKRLEEEKNEIIKEYPPLDWEYEKSVIYGRDNL